MTTKKQIPNLDFKKALIYQLDEKDLKELKAVLNSFIYDLDDKDLYLYKLYFLLNK